MMKQVSYSAKCTEFFFALTSIENEEIKFLQFALIQKHCFCEFVLMFYGPVNS